MANSLGRRLRSWWRHEAHRHGPLREVQQEEEVREEYQAPRRQTRPLPGTRPEQLTATPRPQAAFSVGHVAAGAPSLFVAPVGVHDGLDDATVQFLVQQVLQARTAEEEEAKEVAEVKELQDDMALQERRLVEALERDRAEGVRTTRHSWAALSRCRKGRRSLVSGQGEGGPEEGEEKEGEGGGGGGRGGLCSALHDVLRFSLPLVRQRLRAHASVVQVPYFPCVLCEGGPRS